MNAAISWRSQECSTAWILISSSRHLIFLVHRVANTMVQSIIPPSHGRWGDPLSTLPLKNPPRHPVPAPHQGTDLQAPRTPIRCETFDWFGLQNISISVFGQVTIIAHVRMSSHFSRAGEQRQPDEQEGQKGLPVPGATLCVPWMLRNTLGPEGSPWASLSCTHFVIPRRHHYAHPQLSFSICCWKSSKFQDRKFSLVFLQWQFLWPGEQ